jgi:tungstate transport system substrate-binding protein
MMHRRPFLAFVLATATSLAAAGEPQALRMSTTTSTDNSGLLNYLLPLFEAKTHVHVKVIAVGTGKALELARNGDVDVTLVHARPAEDKFVAEGWGIDRHDVMYNDFVIAGPVADPARIGAGHDVLAAMRKLAAADVKFISRGDNSGTDMMEHGYWKAIGTQPQAGHYVSAGRGMGEVLNMAGEMGAYTLTDRATYATYKARTGLAILVEGDPKMFNPYGIIAVNPARHPGTNYAGATQLINWITSAEGQKAIAAFRPEGQQLFFPSAH